MTPASFEERSDGYERWRSWDPEEQRERYVYVHQLTAIANGADPYQVFSDGAFHIHHINGVKWDNRPENLRVERRDRHARITFEHDVEHDRPIATDGGDRP